MATKAELLAKIEKAKSNKLMPDNLKAKYIADREKEIAALGDDGQAPKTGTKPFEKGQGSKMTDADRELEKLKRLKKGDQVFDTKKEKWATIRKKSKPAKGSALESELFILDVTYEDGKKAMNMPISQYTVKEKTIEVEAVNKTKPKYKKGDVVIENLGEGAHPIEYIVESSSFDEETKQFMYEVKKKNAPAVTFEFAENAILPAPKAKEKKSEKKADPKKEEGPKDKKFSSKKDEDYCEELLSRERARHESSKKSAAKSPAAKSSASIDKAVDGIETKYKEGELTKEQILKLIQEFRRKIKHLEKLLKTAK